MPARSITRVRPGIPTVAAVIFVAILCACSHGSGDTVAPRADTTATTPPPSPRVFDLRFKGVGVLSGVGLENTAVLAHINGGGVWQDFDRAVGSPLSLGSGICSVTDCAWFLTIFALPSNVVRVSTSYRTGIIADLARFTDPTIADTVITSLDLQPSVGVFGLSEFATSPPGGYHLTQRLSQRSGFQAAASAEGASKRVITAVAFDSGMVRFLSYAWDADTTQGYEAKVIEATLASVGAAAQGLAADGYAITAIGGNPADGFLLVGTRLRGQTQARSLLINPTIGTNLAGYAIVGYLFDAQAGGASTRIMER